MHPDLFPKLHKQRQAEYEAKVKLDPSFSLEYFTEDLNKLSNGVITASLVRDFFIFVTICLIVGIVGLAVNFTPVVWVVKAWMLFIAILIGAGFLAKFGDK